MKFGGPIHHEKDTGACPVLETVSSPA